MTPDATRRSGGGTEAAAEMVAETASTVTPGWHPPEGAASQARLSGFDLPVPELSADELIAFAQGWISGYTRGQEDGFETGFETADTVLKGAIAAALGKPGDDYTTAVRRANRSLAVIQNRRLREVA